MTMTRGALLGSLLLAGACWGADAGTAPSTTCKLGPETFRLELRMSKRGEFDSVEAFIVATKKAELKVPFSEMMRAAFLAPGAKQSSACDRTAAVVVGDAVLIAFTSFGGPVNDDLCVLLYSPARHAVDWHSDDAGPVTDEKAASEPTPTGLCFQSGWVHDTGGCSGMCGKTHGVAINHTETSASFDTWRCLTVAGGKVAVAVDPSRTWERLQPRERQAFVTRAAFEKAFGWANGDYAFRAYVYADLADKRTCIFPSKRGDPPKNENDWVCPPLEK